MAAKPFPDLLQIVSNGGGLDIKIDGLTTPQLVQLVGSAKSNSTIIFEALKRKRQRT